METHAETLGKGCFLLFYIMEEIYSIKIWTISHEVLTTLLVFLK